MKEGYIVVRNNKQIAKVMLEEILYVLRDKRRVLMTAEEDFVFYERMNTVVKHLDERFAGILESCYINMDRVRSIRNEGVVFDDGRTLFLSRESVVKAKRLFFDYIKYDDE